MRCEVGLEGGCRKGINAFNTFKMYSMNLMYLMKYKPINGRFVDGR